MSHYIDVQSPFLDVDVYQVDVVMVGRGQPYI